MADITKRHMRAVAMLAKGSPLEQIALHFKVDISDVGKWLAEVSEAWHAPTPSAMVIVCAQKLPRRRRPPWDNWAASQYAQLQPLDPLQLRLVLALALKASAHQKLEDLAISMGMEHEALAIVLNGLLDRLPDVQTRAGLTMVCYLMRPEAQLKAAIARIYIPALTIVTPLQLEVMRLATCGCTDIEIGNQLSLAGTTSRRYLQRLCQKLKAGSRRRLTLVYIFKYMTVQERQAWKEEVVFEWPTQLIQIHILQLMLSWDHCNASNARIGQLLGITEKAVNGHIRDLENRLHGWRRSRQTLLIAAVLHLPRR